MKNYLFFTILVLFLITISSCTSNEDILEGDNPLVDLLTNHSESIASNKERIEKLEEEIEKIKLTNEKVNAAKEKIENLEKTSSGFSQRLADFKLEIEKIKNDIINGGDELSNIERSLTDLNSLVQNYIEENRIHYGDISISSDEDYELFVKKKFKTIVGHLIIQYLDRKDFSGMESITSVGGLTIYDNPYLETTKGLDNLVSIGHNLTITDNGSLKGMTFFNLKFVDGYLSLRRNPLIRNLKGLNSLIAVGKVLNIEDCEALTDLEGLENLTTVGNTVDIDGNDSLRTLDGIENLAIVGEKIVIIRNPNLSSFVALKKVIDAGFSGFFRCKDNAFNPTGKDLKNGVFL